MKKAIYYLTFNGIFNDTNGIATQTINTIQMISDYRFCLESQYGEFDFYIICPAPSDKSWGYNQEYFNSVKSKLEKENINLYLCPIDNSIDFWNVRNWNILCDKASDYLLQQTKNYSRNLVMCVDTPYIQIGNHLLNKGFPDNINVLLILYGGAHIIDEHLDSVRLKWEQDGINATKNSERIKIADVGNGMSQVLKDKYGCQSSNFLQYKTGIALEATNSTSSDYEPTNNKPIIFAFGRAHPLKGFDSVIKTAAELKDISHLVLLTPGAADDECVILYKKLKQKYYPEMTLITDFNRDLPKTIITHPNTKIVICPSYKECFSNIPLEVSILDKGNGVVLLCRDIESYKEVVTDSYNGFIFADDFDMKGKIQHILNLSDTERKQISANAYTNVIKNYQMIDKFRELLNSLSFQS